MNIEGLSDVGLPLPAIEEQQRFEAIVKRHERIRAVQSEALRQADHLFETLLHRAFSVAATAGS